MAIIQLMCVIRSTITHCNILCAIIRWSFTYFDITCSFEQLATQNRHEIKTFTKRCWLSLSKNFKLNNKFGQYQFRESISDEMDARWNPQLQFLVWKVKHIFVNKSCIDFRIKKIVRKKILKKKLINKCINLVLLLFRDFGAFV